MTEQGPQPQRAAPARAMIQGFPAPGRRVEHAYRELDIALYGTTDEKKVLGSPRVLPRPWDPPTCLDPELREQLWEWLDRVVAWLNREYVWDVAGMIPACWPRHPHLVHEVAVLADLRRRAGHALTGDAMEEWHRYALPAFTERMRQRMKAHCEDKEHQPWPAHGRHTRHLTTNSAAMREQVFQADVATLTVTLQPATLPRAQLHLVDGVRVDPDTGEVLD
ncbi:MAG: hypothetical protein ACOYBY_15235 [Dermatophilaceae bacterium]